MAQNPFDTFAATLSEGERDELYSSVLWLISSVVQADGDFDGLEMEAVSGVLVFDLAQQLDDRFRFHPAANREYGALQLGKPSPDPRPAPERLASIRRIIDRMPPDLQARYRAFVSSVCLRMAQSSGSLLWFGKRISKPEQESLRAIFTTLGIELDAAQRKKLGL